MSTIDKPIRIGKNETAEEYLQRLINAGHAEVKIIDNSQWYDVVREGKTSTTPKE